ncbi:hypothetical protein ANANG_G00302040 [Anguilla anguilla]|uniref:Uncharacterized protein n=1 Tax=Anguilla anguilla TaxID=7936 RepID=A0A9D3LI75_ANGAN|nr:hypothetical protein ANANG_G00302040 [Anguilla anguilla]
MATKDSLFPRIPRQHYCSYGQIPLPPPFSFLSQDSPLPSPTGTTSYLLPADAGRRRFSMVQSDSLLTRVRSMAGDDLTEMMQRRMSEENPARASESELVQRLQRLVVLAVNRLIYHDISQDCFDLLNMTESSAQQPGPGEQAPGQNGLAPPLTSIRSFQKAILRLMVEGMKISLVSILRNP